jgi:hypothetical protein
VVILPQQSHQAKEAAKNCKNTAKEQHTREHCNEILWFQKFHLLSKFNDIAQNAFL